MSDCRHEWRHTFDGVECNLCRQVASVGWLIDELSDAEGLLADLRIQRDVAERELAEARATIEASDTTRREWEVRAATSYAAGRAAGLREAAEAVTTLRDAFVLRANQAAHMSTSHRNATAGVVAVERAMGAIAALAPPAAETVNHTITATSFDGRKASPYACDALPAAETEVDRG